MLKEAQDNKCLPKQGFFLIYNHFNWILQNCNLAELESVIYRFVI